MGPTFWWHVRFILHRFQSTQSLTAAQCLILYSLWIHTELINQTCHSRGQQHLCHQPAAVWLCSATICYPCCRGREKLFPFLLMENASDWDHSQGQFWGDLGWAEDDPVSEVNFWHFWWAMQNIPIYAVRREAANTFWLWAAAGLVSVFWPGKTPN